jgi:hypothetical protein
VISWLAMCGVWGTSWPEDTPRVTKPLNSTQSSNSLLQPPPRHGAAWRSCESSDAAVTFVIAV